MKLPSFFSAKLSSWSQKRTSCVFHPFIPFPHPLPFLPQRNKWTLCDLGFWKVSPPKLLNRLSAASPLTDGWKWQQRCKQLSKLFPSRDCSHSLCYVALKHFPSTWVNVCVSFTGHEQNLSEAKFPTSRRLVIFGVIIRPRAKISWKSSPL